VLCVFHPVGLAVGDDDGGVVEQSVENRRCGGVLGQEPTPLLEWPVRGDRQWSTYADVVDMPTLPDHQTHGMGHLGFRQGCLRCVGITPVGSGGWPSGASCSGPESASMAGTRRRVGPMSPFVVDYRDRLTELGYTTAFIRGMVKVLGQLDLW
jgi:hypothetical protein